MEKEVRKIILNMSEEKFKEFCKSCTKEQIKTMQTMRFFNKLYNDSAFYKTVEKAIAEVAYKELKTNKY